MVHQKHILCMGALLLTAATAFGQGVAGLGGVAGVVRDASDAVITDATVVVSNDAKGIRRTLQTTAAGVFSAPALTPSSGYSLKVSKTGFADFEVKDFEILVGQTVDFKVVMQVQGTASSVMVTAEAPLVEQTKTGVSQASITTFVSTSWVATAMLVPVLTCTCSAILASLTAFSPMPSLYVLRFTRMSGYLTSIPSMAGMGDHWALPLFYILRLGGHG